jgi:hypothetical protein
VMETRWKWYFDSVFVIVKHMYNSQSVTAFNNSCLLFTR